MNRTVRKILIWWSGVIAERRLRTIPSYRKAARAEYEAMRRGSTQAVHRAREAKRAAVHDSMRGAV